MINENVPGNDFDFDLQGADVYNTIGTTLIDFAKVCKFSLHSRDTHKAYKYVIGTNLEVNYL